MLELSDIERKISYNITEYVESKIIIEMNCFIKQKYKTNLWLIKEKEGVEGGQREKL